MSKRDGTVFTKLVLVALLTQAAVVNAGCMGAALYDLVGFNEASNEILVRSLIHIQEPEGSVTLDNANEAVVTAATVKFPPVLRIVGEIGFDKQLVGKKLTEGTDEIIAEALKRGFKKIEYREVKARKESETRVSFEDPLHPKNSFIVERTGLGGQMRLLYAYENGKTDLLRGRLLGEKGYALGGTKLPDSLVFWDKNLTGLSSWCFRPSPWTYQLQTSRLKH